MSLMTEVEKGLPLTALDRLAKAVAPNDASFAFRMVSRATLARRRKALATTRNTPAARLSADESARVARLAEVWALAREVWGGDEEARAFLFRPHPMLEGRRPIDVVLANEFGRPLVEGILGGLQYGSAA
jgi:putative toxin-antitoxin system antitoxin component (TIGR02293 family)